MLAQSQSQTARAYSRMQLPVLVRSDSTARNREVGMTLLKLFMKTMKTILLAAGILISAFVWCSGQTPTQKKPLTNADVLQMVKAGLAEGVIVAAIQSSPANYDTSPTALIDLNKQGVSAKVQ